jgi:nitrate reductase alpha subunit
MLAPETNGHVAVKAWARWASRPASTTPIWRLHREDEKIRFRDIQAQPRKIISSPTWSGIESETVSYNAGYTNVHELIPWRTLTGRQQFYMDHPWMQAFGEGFSSYRPPVDLKTTAGSRASSPMATRKCALNFITPHQKWGIHSTYTDNLLMLTLSRGGPCVWLSETTPRKAGIVDNDWIELFNINGAIAARAVVSQRVKPGMVMMYHAQEKIVNTPGSEITGVARRHPQLGHAHRTQAHPHDWRLRTVQLRLQLLRNHRHQPRRICDRAQDEKVDWLEGPADPFVLTRHRSRMKVRAQIGMVLNLDKCIGCHTCSVTCKKVWTSRDGVEYAWFNNVESKPGDRLPQGLGEPARSGTAAGCFASPMGSIWSLRQGGQVKLHCRQASSPTRTCRRSTTTTSRSTFDYGHLQSAPEMQCSANGAAALA